jgi:hypothetical protein
MTTPKANKYGEVQQVLTCLNNEKDVRVRDIYSTHGVTRTGLNPGYNSTAITANASVTAAVLLSSPVLISTTTGSGFTYTLPGWSAVKDQLPELKLGDMTDVITFMNQGANAVTIAAPGAGTTLVGVSSAAAGGSVKLRFVYTAASAGVWLATA